MPSPLMSKRSGLSPFGSRSGKKGGRSASPGPARKQGKAQLKAGHHQRATAQLKLERKQISALEQNDEIFDVHCFYLDWRQKTDGIDALLGAMTANGIGMAALTGCPLKKSWVDAEVPPEHHLYDDGDLYFYSLTDGLVYRDLQRADNGSSLTPRANASTQAKLLHTACGFNLGDRGVGEEAEHVIEEFDVHGLGVLYLQSDDINNMTVKGGNWTFAEPAVSALLGVASKASPHPLPFLFVSDACSSTSKPYREAFEYLGEVEYVLTQAPTVRCVWVACGVFYRGQWKGFVDILKAMLTDYPNLFISLTPELIAGELALPESFAIEIATAFPDRCLLGTTIRGNFTQPPSVNFAGRSYASQCETLRSFLNTVEKAITEEKGAEAAAIARSRIRYINAGLVYNLLSLEDVNRLTGGAIDVADDTKVAETAAQKAAFEEDTFVVNFDDSSSGERVNNLRNSRTPVKSGRKHSVAVTALIQKATADEQEALDAGSLLDFMNDLAYGGGAIGEHQYSDRKSNVCPPSKVKSYKTIDCHLHLLDFLQKSSGTQAALKAMDGCEVERAVVFGMPCCKKWSFYRPEQPLYYQDDNGPCYVYSYADQMVADAWLALADSERKRIAPCFASFDPTDLGAISHIQRMYRKYPQMWRAVGEVMCRHDDLTNMMMGKEIPRVNHEGLDRIFDFCVETDLPILVHHNAGRVGDTSDGSFYLSEVEDVLKRYPGLKFTWVHAGVSRGCAQPEHHKMIDTMLSNYPNLKVDISWVVWEDVICDADGVVKPAWVEVVQKHNTRIFIGSDNVAQFFPIKDTSVNLLAVNITKYWQLFDKLTPEAAENVAYKNAYKEYFDNWDVPTGSRGGRYARGEAFYECESLDPKEGEFVVGRSDLSNEVGKY